MLNVCCHRVSRRVKTPSSLKIRFLYIAHSDFFGYFSPHSRIEASLSALQHLCSSTATTLQQHHRRKISNFSSDGSRFASRRGYSLNTHPSHDRDTTLAAHIEFQLPKIFPPGPDGRHLLCFGRPSSSSIGARCVLN